MWLRHTLYRNVIYRPHQPFTIKSDNIPWQQFQFLFFRLIHSRRKHRQHLTHGSYRYTYVSCCHCHSQGGIVGKQEVTSLLTSAPIFTFLQFLYLKKHKHRLLTYVFVFNLLYKSGNTRRIHFIWCIAFTLTVPRPHDSTTYWPVPCSHKVADQHNLCWCHDVTIGENKYQSWLLPTTYIHCNLN